MGNQRDAWHAERRKRIDAIKTDQGCLDCGYADHPAALQFDHREGMTKSFGISNNLQRAWDAILAEIAKCDTRCANCHAIKTAERGYGSGRPRNKLVR